LNPINSIHEKTKLPELVERLSKNPSSSFYTVNDMDQITGVITEVELRPILTEYDNLKDFLVANDIANPQVTFANPDDDLDHILRLFSKLNVDSIPVVSNDTAKEILGAISRQEILLIYNHESLKLNLTHGLSEELKTNDDFGSSTVAPGYSIAEIVVPTELINKSLSELKIRSDHGLEVLMITHPQEIFSESKEKEMIVSADPNYKIKWGDKLVVFGKDENIEKFKKI
jgi:CBS-domain-containing membrane protein